MPNQKTTSEISWTFKIFRLFSVRKIECSRTGYHIFFKEKSKPLQNNFICKNCIIFQQQSVQTQIQVLLS